MFICKHNFSGDRPHLQTSGSYAVAVIPFFTCIHEDECVLFNVFISFSVFFLGMGQAPSHTPLPAR